MAGGLHLACRLLAGFLALTICPAARVFSDDGDAGGSNRSSRRLAGCPKGYKKSGGDVCVSPGGVEFSPSGSAVLMIKLAREMMSSPSAKELAEQVAASTRKHENTLSKNIADAAEGAMRGMTKTKVARHVAVTGKNVFVNLPKIQDALIGSSEFLVLISKDSASLATSLAQALEPLIPLAEDLAAGLSSPLAFIVMPLQVLGNMYKASRAHMLNTLKADSFGKAVYYAMTCLGRLPRSSARLPASELYKRKCAGLSDSDFAAELEGAMKGTLDAISNLLLNIKQTARCFLTTGTSVFSQNEPSNRQESSCVGNIEVFGANSCQHRPI
eukprot:TRINITY_DN17236_c0_g1_i3.p1 TRINITY_DN17236_c0_g1~~TRINITY_DN17236_c0_g1_i3.p1  ORF type:complete len:328 (+),score=48.79 TRINITY_DN17236_c0_g1_i3:107-1090(+)